MAYSKPDIQTDWPQFDPFKVQAVKHRLIEHPLLQLDSLQRLAARLAEKGSVRTHNDQAAPDTNFNDAPDTHKAQYDANETIKRIKEAKAWMSLLNVQRDPEYRKLVDEILDDVRPHIEERDPGMHFRAGWIFVTSPNAITPFHFDHEHNFILQIHGNKTVHVWEPLDRNVVTEEALELFHAKHKRDKLVLNEEVQKRAMVFEFKPGDGAYMPQTAPHWVKNGNDVSVTISCTYYTEATRRRQLLHRTNYSLRQLGIKPAPVEGEGVREGLRHLGLRIVQRGSDRLKALRGKAPYGDRIQYSPGSE